AFPHPVCNHRNLLVRQSSFIHEFAMAVRGMPRRHVSGRCNGGDESTAFLNILIRCQRKRRSFSGAVTCHAIRVNNRRNMFAECNCLRGESLRHREQESNRTKQSAHDYLPFRRISAGSMKQPTACVWGFITGFPAKTASSASRKS